MTMTITDATTGLATDTAAAGDHAAAEHGYIGDKARHLNRLKRIEGQVRGVSKMVEDERYCIDVLTQLSAVTRALEGVALALLDDHLRCCVLDAAAQGDDHATVKLAEASAAIARLVRS